MAYLSDPKETIAVLNRYHFAFKKRFGQNFLIDPHVLEKILRTAEITPEDTVLEIGPGIGTLTQALCEHAKRVVAVEIDRTLIPILREDTCKDYDNLTLINDDVLKVDLHELSRRFGNCRFRVVANLPYYITTPILMGLLEQRVPLKNLTVMVQKEVAQRMQAGPGTKEYGALSLAVQYYARPYLAANVPPNCFLPRPGVGSAVICLTPHSEPPVTVSDEAFLFALIRAAFGQRRKTLVNSLANAPELSLTKERIAAALAEMGLSETVRGEALSLEQFARLTELLS